MAELLQDVLRSEAIKYSVFPVYGYDDIVTHASKGISSNLVRGWASITMQEAQGRNCELAELLRCPRGNYLSG